MDFPKSIFDPEAFGVSAPKDLHQQMREALEQLQREAPRNAAGRLSRLARLSFEAGVYSATLKSPTPARKIPEHPASPITNRKSHYPEGRLKTLLLIEGA